MHTDVARSRTKQYERLLGDQMTKSVEKQVHEKQQDYRIIAVSGAAKGRKDGRAKKRKDGEAERRRRGEVERWKYRWCILDLAACQTAKF